MLCRVSEEFEAKVDALEGQIASKVDEKQVRKIVENMTTDSIIKEPPHNHINLCWQQ